MSRLAALALLGALAGCAQWGAEAQWDSQVQVLRSEDSQVRLRALQSRTFDTTDRAALLRAVVATLQDHAFQIDVADARLGVVSAKAWHASDAAWADDPSYYAYDVDALLAFAEHHRTWGPFAHRRDLVRVTVTIRPKETTRSLVRASAQYDLRAVEDPALYQRFFAALRRAWLLEQQARG